MPKVGNFVISNETGPNNGNNLQEPANYSGMRIQRMVGSQEDSRVMVGVHDE